MRLVTFFVFLSLIISPASSKGTKHKKPTQDNRVITKVDSTSITIRDYKVSRTFKIGPDTVITYNGQPSKVAALTRGMKVEVAVAMDPSIAARISASDP